MKKKKVKKPIIGLGKSSLPKGHFIYDENELERETLKIKYYEGIKINY